MTSGGPSLPRDIAIDGYPGTVMTIDELHWNLSTGFFAINGAERYELKKKENGIQICALNIQKTTVVV